MVNSQKSPKMNGNIQDKNLFPLEEVKSILFAILPKKTASEIIKVLPMYLSDSAIYFNFIFFIFLIK